MNEEYCTVATTMVINSNRNMHKSNRMFLHEGNEHVRKDPRNGVSHGKSYPAVAIKRGTSHMEASTRVKNSLHKVTNLVGW